MTREEYTEDIKTVIKMVFVAEHEVYKQHPELKERFENKQVSPEEYITLVADEIMSTTPDELFINE